MSRTLGTVQQAILTVLDAQNARDYESAVSLRDLARQIFDDPDPVQEQGVRNALRTLERRGLVKTQFWHRNQWGQIGGDLSAYLIGGDHVQEATV